MLTSLLPSSLGKSISNIIKTLACYPAICLIESLEIRDKLQTFNIAAEKRLTAEDHATPKY